MCAIAKLRGNVCSYGFTLIRIALNRRNVTKPWIVGMWETVTLIHMHLKKKCLRKINHSKYVFLFTEKRANLHTLYKELYLLKNFNVMRATSWTLHSKLTPFVNLNFKNVSELLQNKPRFCSTAYRPHTWQYTCALLVNYLSLTVILFNFLYTE